MQSDPEILQTRKYDMIITHRGHALWLADNDLSLAHNKSIDSHSHKRFSSLLLIRPTTGSLLVTCSLNNKWKTHTVSYPAVSNDSTSPTVSYRLTWSTKSSVLANGTCFIGRSPFPPGPLQSSLNVRAWGTQPVGFATLYPRSLNQTPAPTSPTHAGREAFSSQNCAYRGGRGDGQGLPLTVKSTSQTTF